MHRTRFRSRHAWALPLVALFAWTPVQGIELIAIEDYSDTFTFESEGGLPGRANGVFGAGAIASYALEETNGNPPSTWTPQTNFSFNNIPGSFGDGPTVLAAATGNPGAATGFAQSGGGDFGMAYGLRTDYVVVLDAFLSPGDRTDVTSTPSPGGGIGEASSLSVFFRREGAGNGELGIYTPAVGETTLGVSGIDNLDDNWHQIAVRFNHDDDQLVIWIDGVVKADLDLTTFAGGAYQNYSNGAISIGGAGAFVRNLVNWFDNFRVGAPFVFQDDFERPDGPVDGWTVFRGGWDLSGGRLHTGPTAAEHWAWAGSPAVSVPDNFVFEFDYEFLAPGNNATVGRHGGAFFCANEPTERSAASSNGYAIYWIDRAIDFGFTLVRYDGAAVTYLQRGTFDAVAAPPVRWRVEVVGPAIKVYGDDVLYIDVLDSTYRNGHCGVWAWSGAEEIAVDNVGIYEPSTGLALPCFSAPQVLKVSGTDVTLDGSCSQAVNSGDIVSWSWDFGDGEIGSGEIVSHAWATGGLYPVVLTIETSEGLVASTSIDISVGQAILSYDEEFAFADGPMPGWFTASGVWSVAGEALHTGPSSVENFVWAGDPAAPDDGLLVAPPNSVFEFDLAFLAPGNNPAVGRHGGFQFHCSRPTLRSGAGAFNGYLVDWIDRASDRGVRLTRADGGVFVGLGLGQLEAATADPPARWRIEVEGDRIRVYGDDVLLVDVVDGTHRGGYFGAWVWSGAEEMTIDNLNVTGDPVNACFTTSPRLPLVTDVLTFDGSCSSVFGGLSEIVAWRWDLGDGTTEEGAVVEHSYAAVDSYTVVLEVEDATGATATVSRVVSVSEPLTPFVDCFDRAAGPVDGWTSFQGDWNVSGDEDLSTVTAGLEHWLWAGSPPQPGRGDFSAEFDLDYLLTPADGVGRHGGVMFYAGDPTIRWQTTGYTVWWIDRPQDFGIVVARWANGGLEFLNPGTFEAVENPPLRWRIEVEGPMIRVYGDGTLYVEVEDDTYREGYFGLWMYSNGQDVRFDNVVIESGSLPTCDLSLDVSVVEGDTVGLRVDAILEDCACDCERIELRLDGELLGDYAVGEFPLTLDLPADCEGDVERLVSARCTAAGGEGLEASASFVCPVLGVGPFIRSDCNGDGNTGSVTDAVYHLNYNFNGGPTPPCVAACDSNGDGGIGSVTDAVYTLGFFFLGGPAPVAPFPDCGTSALESDAVLGCETPRVCL